MKQILIKTERVNIGKCIFVICLLFLFSTLNLLAEEAVVLNIIGEKDSSVPIRAAMSEDAKILTTLTSGDEIIAIIENDNWYKVIAPDYVDANGSIKYGYIKVDHEKIIENPSLPSDVQGKETIPETSLTLKEPKKITKSISTPFVENYLQYYQRLGDKYSNIIERIDNNLLDNLQVDINDFIEAIAQYPRINQVTVKNDLLTIYSYLAYMYQNNQRLKISGKTDYKKELKDIYNKCLEIYNSEPADSLKDSFFTLFKESFMEDTQILEKVEKKQQL